jgi:murein endopeptidase
MRTPIGPIAITAFVALLWSAQALATTAPQPKEAADSVGAESEITSSDKNERRWIKHKVIPHERLDEIAGRYGVSRGELVRWNKKKLGPKQWIFTGQVLKVYARKFPPPRERITYQVQFGDTWAGIATKFNVQASDLHAWNKKVPRQFKAGRKITVYTNPSDTPPEEEAELEAEPPVETIQVRAGGLSVGRPNRGRLINGVRLPESDLYSIRDEDKAWGSSHTIEVIQRCLAGFRRATEFAGDVAIGAISKRGGGRFRPHSSHQSGRDVDIRLPKKPGASKKSSSSADIDWRMSWALIQSFIASGEVEYIFLDYNRQKQLYGAAKAAGATRAELAKAIQYPRARKSNNGVVRHAEGHLIHIHVRITCSQGNSRCQSY